VGSFPFSLVFSPGPSSKRLPRHTFFLFVPGLVFFSMGGRGHPFFFGTSLLFTDRKGGGGGGPCSPPRKPFSPLGSSVKGPPSPNFGTAFFPLCPRPTFLSLKNVWMVARAKLKPKPPFPPRVSRFCWAGIILFFTYWASSSFYNEGGGLVNNPDPWSFLVKDVFFFFPAKSWVSFSFSVFTPPQCPPKKGQTILRALVCFLLPGFPWCIFFLWPAVFFFFPAGEFFFSFSRGVYGEVSEFPFSFSVVQVVARPWMGRKVSFLRPAQRNFPLVRIFSRAELLFPIWSAGTFFFINPPPFSGR